MTTERLIIKHWERAGIGRLFEICSDSEVMYRIGDGKPFERIEQAEKFLVWVFSSQKENGFSRWALAEKESGKIIGSCGFALLNNGEVELGYLLARDYWGRGLATEAAKACAKYGFEKLGFENVVALTDIDHAETHGVLKKVGFKKRGVETIHVNEDLVFELKPQDIVDS